jgi:NADPH-dependent 2,4-dienoyl-CoA reductase/sulfur reductase-like enzyme
MKIVLIGSISAGVSAARRISAGLKNVQISVYEKSAFFSCGAYGLPHYLTVSMEELQEAVDGKEREMNAQSIEAHSLSEVTAVDPSAHTVAVRDLKSGAASTVRYDRLIVATGSGAAIPAVSGAGKLGVQQLRGVEDLLFLKEMTRTPYVRDIAVLGGGYEAIEIAKAFRKMDRQVRVIAAEREILTDYDPEVSAMIRA